MDAGHLLTNRDFQRVGDAVRRVEGTYNIAGESAEQRGGSNVQVLQIQAGAANDFGYPARIQKWSNSAGTWSDLSTTEVRVENPNGGPLAEGHYTLARFLGINAANVGCFITQAATPTLTSFSFDYPWVGAPAEIPISTNTTLHTLTLNPGIYIVTVDVPLEVWYGFGGGTSHCEIIMSWALGTALGVIPPNSHSYETLVSTASLPSISNPYFTDTIVVTQAGTVALNVLWNYLGSAVPTVNHGLGHGAGTGYHLTITEGVSPYAISSIAVGATPITGGTSGNILYNNAGALGGATGTRIVSDALEVKIASDRWVAFSKGSF